MKKEYVFIISLVALVGVLFGFGSRAGFFVQSFLRGDSFVLNGTSFPADRLTASLVSPESGGITVAVYSSYPFNLKNELSVAAGSLEGVGIGDTAVYGGHLVGVVRKVFEHSSIVQTIFDAGFQMPVRIGVANADALLRGGNDPTLTLIGVTAAVGDGEQAYSAAANIPYGLAIGTLRNLRDSDDKAFRESSLSFPYDPNKLNVLTLIPSPTK